jgi:hypothetical protein
MELCGQSSVIKPKSWISRDVTMDVIHRMFEITLSYLLSYIEDKMLGNHRAIHNLHLLHDVQSKVKQHDEFIK